MLFRAFKKPFYMNHRTNRILEQIPDISVNNYSPFEKQLLAYDWALSDNEHLTIGHEGPGCHYKLGVI